MGETDPPKGGSYFLVIVTGNRVPELHSAPTEEEFHKMLQDKLLKLENSSWVVAFHGDEIRVTSPRPHFLVHGSGGTPKPVGVDLDKGPGDDRAFVPLAPT